MCAPSPPPPPDYEAAAREQGQANVEAARTTGKLSNPNVISPTGTQTVTYGGGPPTFNQQAYDSALAQYNKNLEAYNAQPPVPPLFQLFPRAAKFGGGAPGTTNRLPEPTAPDPNQFYYQSGDPDVPTVTQTLSPAEQEIYEQGTQTRGVLGDIGTQGAEALRGIVGVPIDYSGAPAAPSGAEGTRQSVIDAMMSRVRQDTEERRNLTRSQLIAAGIPEGSEAWNRAMRSIDRQYNDAYTRAEIAGGQEAQRDFDIDTAARRNAIAEMLTSRQTPLNEITGLMSGSQVSNPFMMPGFAGSGQVAPAPLYGATSATGNYMTDLYNADVGAQNAMMQGLFGIGAATAPYWGPLLFASDRRLKSNIKRIGTHPLGIGIYEYDIFGNREVGVMAQEASAVKPDAVFTHPSGYLMVDYGRL